jgi:hypothetical protein
LERAATLDKSRLQRNSARLKSYALLMTIRTSCRSQMLG